MKFKQSITFDGRNLNDIFAYRALKVLTKARTASHTLSCIVAVRRAD